MEPISTGALILTIGLICLFVIVVQAADAKRTYRTEENQQPALEDGENHRITDTEALSRRLTEHERRVEDKLDKIYGILNFFKTLVILQIAITVIAILFTISKIGIAVSAFSKFMPYIQ